MISETLFSPKRISPNIPFRFGLVVDINAHSATVKFDGEESASEKYYKCLENYTPSANDRVILAWQSGTGVILGKF